MPALEHITHTHQIRRGAWVLQRCLAQERELRDMGAVKMWDLSCHSHLHPGKITQTCMIKLKRRNFRASSVHIIGLPYTNSIWASYLTWLCHMLIQKKKKKTPLKQSVTLNSICKVPGTAPKTLTRPITVSSFPSPAVGSRKQCR